MTTNEELMKYNDNQWVFIYNELKKDMKFHPMIEKSKAYGEYLTKESVYQMYTISDSLPVVKSNGDCKIQGQVYKVRPEIFKQLIKFHYAMSPRKIKLDGFKKRVWIWEVTDVSRFMLKVLDKPTNMVYNWGIISSSLPNNTILQPTKKEEKTMAQSTPVTKHVVPTTYTPIKTDSEGNNPVNTDNAVYKILTAIEGLEELIWNSKISDRERGTGCKETIESLRELSKSLVAIYN